MTIYGRWVTTCIPAVEQIRLSHVYFVTKGSERPRKVSLRVPPEQIDRQWQRIDRVAGLLVDVAQERDADKVEANTRACGAFGGCPHRAYCRAGRPTAHAALADVFGEDGAAHLLKRSREVTVTAPAPVNIAARKSLLGAKKPADDPAALKAAAQKVAREEIEAKHPGFPAAWDELISLGVGHPKLSGEFARVVSELRGEDPPTGGQLAGAGELADEGPFGDPRELPDLVAALRTNLADRADTAPTPATPTPTPTPAASTPAPTPPASSAPPAACPATTPTPATPTPAPATRCPAHRRCCLRTPPRRIRCSPRRRPRRTTLVAEYQTMLPPKALLRRKLHELYARLAPEAASAASAEPASQRRADGRPRPTRPRRAR